MSRLATVCLSAGLVLVLSGCGVVESSGASSTRGAVAQLVRDIDHRRADDIDAWARYAENANYGYGAKITLIGIRHGDGDELGDVLGTLEFASEATIHNVGLFAAGTIHHQACYAVDFSYYGVESIGRGDYGDRDLTREIDCPDPIVAVAAPPDTAPVYVVPEGTEELVVAVLAAAGPHPDAEDIRLRIAAGLRAPTGEREVAYEPQVEVTADGAIGFAMGHARDCLLVRRVGDDVARVYPPRVYLQEGEMGCYPGTALAEDLRPPH